MISTLTFILVLSVLIIVHEFGHFIAARRVGVRVEKFSVGFGPQVWKKKINETEYGVSIIPLGGYVKLAGDCLEEHTGKPDEYFSKSVFARFKIIFCGPLLNYILGFAFFWLVFFIGYPSLTTRVGEVLDGFGAKVAGIQVGDKIIAIDGKKVSLWDQMQKEVQSKRETLPVKVLVLRGDKELEIPVRIKEKVLRDALGKKHSIGLLGIAPGDEVIRIRQNFLQSFVSAVNKTWELTLLTYEGLWRMLSGQLSVRESVTGPLGIFYITSKAAQIGLMAVLHLTAVLSVSLAIFNLLPFPVLDGGHILFLGIEKIRGRTLGAKAEKVLTQIGMTAIISLALFVTYNDILRLFGDKMTKFFK